MCIFILTFNCCVCQKKDIPIKVENCILKEYELSEFSLISKNSEIINNEFTDFYNSKNNYDILKFSTKSGELETRIDRWFYKDSQNFFHLVINNDLKSLIEIKIKESEINSIFKNLVSKSFLKVCPDCLHCESGLLLVKKNNLLFKYYYEGSMTNDITDNDKQFFSPFEIIRFFESKN